MKTIEIKNLLDEVEVLQAQIREGLKSVQDDEDDNEKEIRELKEKVEELKEEAEENTTQLFLFAEFLRCSDQELIFAKFVADLEEFGDVALISLLRLITLICQMVFQGCRTSLKMY